MPPCPMWALISYGPRRVPGVSTWRCSAIVERAGLCQAAIGEPRRSRLDELLHRVVLFGSERTCRARSDVAAWPHRPTAHHLGLVPIPSGWRRSPDRRQDLSDPGDVLFWIGDFRVVLSPLQSARALRLHRPLRGRHAIHRLCARPACARTGAQQRPWCEIHRGPASGAAGVSGGVPVRGEGAGTRVRGEATYSRAEGRVGRQRETTPPMNQHVQEQLLPDCGVAVSLSGSWQRRSARS